MKNRLFHASDAIDALLTELHNKELTENLQYLISEWKQRESVYSERILQMTEGILLQGKNGESFPIKEVEVAKENDGIRTRRTLLDMKTFFTLRDIGSTVLNYCCLLFFEKNYFTLIKLPFFP